MGWFEEQIKQRKISDDKAFHETFAAIASSVTGRNFYTEDLDTSIQAANALEGVLKWFHINGKEIPPSITDFNDQCEFLMRPHGIMHRTVDLPRGWWRDAIGPYIGFLKEDGMPVALLPGKVKGYHYVDPHSGETVHLDLFTEKKLDGSGICFYYPFPLKSMTVIDLIKFVWTTRSTTDYVYVLVMMGIGTYLGLGGQHRVDAEHIGDSAGNKRVRGRAKRSHVARFAVPVHKSSAAPSHRSYRP